MTPSTPFASNGAGTAGSDHSTAQGVRRSRSRPSRSQQLQQDIKDLIVARGLTAGDPLPTEFELVDELGVSRNSLREALKALQSIGIVEIRHGYGMYVSRMSLDALVQGLSFHGRISLTDKVNNLADLVEIRQVLELGLVQLLIDRHSEVDLSAAERLADDMATAAAAGPVPPELDQAFHEALYLPLRNPLAVDLLGAFWSAYLQVQDLLGPVDVEFVQTAEQHREIISAIQVGDREAANKAVVRHFDDLRTRLIKLWTANLAASRDRD